MNRSTLFVFATLGAFAAVSVAGAQDTGLPKAGRTAGGGGVAPTKDSTGRILGVLDADTGNPVVGAEVVDRITGVTAAFTNEYGIVRLGSFRSQHDTSVVTVRKIGYQDTTFLAMQEDSTPITLMLEASVPVLPAVIAKAIADKHEYVSPLMREFDERMNDKSLDGAFFPPDLLRKYDQRYLPYVLLDKGVRNDSRGCTMGAKVFLDGRFLGWGIPTGIQVGSLEAIEYYSSASTPERFRMTVKAPNHGLGVGGCGTLLLWSREKG